MKGANSILIIVIGLLILWLGVTGKFDCFSGVLKCMIADPATTPGAAGAAVQGMPGQASASNALARVTAKLGAARPGGLWSIVGTPPFVGDSGGGG